MPMLDARVEPLERVVDACAEVIFAGGTIVFPSDTSYCLACDPYRIATMHEPMELLVASPAEFLEYAPGNPLAVLASKRLLPGPVTLLVRRPSYISDDVVVGAPTVGLHVPDEPLARAILERAGPLVVASVADRTRSGVELIIENGPTRYSSESTIVDLTGRHPRLVREGALPYARLAELLGPVERQTVKVRSQS
ncbi:MAG TPA: Sua5/YciO/YrdC/YwlC family protein [Candidatus Acidoferrum sp.]|nr:Sua5/YciO/YrdC/YwlC family protein [Candidatus Acidoferrum sp.]